MVVWYLYAGFSLYTLPTIQLPVGTRFSAFVLTSPGAHPASCTMGTGSFLGVKQQGMALTTHPHLAPRLKKEWSYTSTPSLGLCGLFYSELYLYPLHNRLQ